MITNWRAKTIEALAEKMGPAAIVVVDEAANKLGIDTSDLDRATYSALLMRLARALPCDIKLLELASVSAMETMSKQEESHGHPITA